MRKLVGIVLLALGLSAQSTGSFQIGLVGPNSLSFKQAVLLEGDFEYKASWVTLETRTQLTKAEKSYANSGWTGRVEQAVYGRRGQWELGPTFTYKTLRSTEFTKQSFQVGGRARVGLGIVRPYVGFRAPEQGTYNRTTTLEYGIDLLVPLDKNWGFKLTVPVYHLWFYPQGATKRTSGRALDIYAGFYYTRK